MSDTTETKRPRARKAASVPADRATATAPTRPAKKAAAGAADLCELHDAPEGRKPLPSAEVPLKMIVESPTNPRRRFDDAALAELANSIHAMGVLQPVLLRPRKGGLFQLVCGARRFRAAKLAGLARIPAVIRPLTDLEALHAQIVENSQRLDVSPMEEAHAFKRLVDLGEPVDEIGERIGRPAKYVRARLTLLELPGDIADIIDAGGIHLGAALAITRLAPVLQGEVLEKIRKDVQDTAWEEIAAKPFTLGDVQEMVRGYARRMTDAPWSLDDASLAPEGAGACSACPYRSGAQPDLFDAAQDRCTNKPCWDERTTAHWERRKASGARVATPEDKPALLSGHTKVGGIWMSGAEIASGVAGVQPVLVPNEHGPGYREAYIRDEVADALVAEGRTELADQVRAKPRNVVEDWKEEQKRLEQRQREARARLDDRMTELLDRMAVQWEASAAQVLQLLTRRFLAAVPSVAVQQAMFRRRGLPDPKPAERVAQLLDTIDDTRPVELVGLLMEVACYSALHMSAVEWLEELATRTGVALREQPPEAPQAAAGDDEGDPDTEEPDEAGEEAA